MEKEYAEGQGHRYRARASRPAPDIHPALGIALELSAVAPTRQWALARALAKILAREERPDPAATIRGRGP